MCIIFIHTNPDPEEGGYRLIIASNRDEHYRRPAREAFKCPHSSIIGGRDLEENRENGMWLGMKLKEDERSLSFGALLNVTGEDRHTDVLSRGFIVPDYLKKDNSPTEFYRKLIKAGKYNAFNLATVELKNEEVSTYFFSNTPNQICEFTGKQTLGFGNSPVNRPLSKVRTGRIQFDNIISDSEGRESLKANLIQMLKSQERNLPDPELAMRAPETFEYLSSIYVEIEKSYGTRTHTIIIVDSNWNVEFYEETMESPIDPINIKWKKNVIKSNL